MKLGPHLCAKFNRLLASGNNGKQRIHLRRCETCKDCLKVERERRLGLAEAAAQVRDAGAQSVVTKPLIETL